MATIANQYDPNNPNANANSGGGGTVMPSTGGGAGGGATGGGGSTPGGTSTPYQPPNVSQYLAANQGAGQQLTQGITGNVQNQANQLNNTANTTSNNLNSQYQPLNQNLGSGGQQTIQTAFKDPQALLDSYKAAKTSSSNAPLTSSQQAGSDQYNQFQQLNSGGYDQAIQNYGNYGQQQQNQLQGQLSNLTQQTGSANTEMGRNQLLQNTIGQGNYNQGQQTLDSLFLQGAPGQRNAQGNSNLQQLQQNLGGIGQNASNTVSNLGTDTQSKLAALQGLSSQDQSSIKNLFLNGGAGGTGINQIASNVGNEYQALQGKTNVDQVAIADALRNNNLTPDQLKSIGLTAGQQTYGVNLNPDVNKYLTNNTLSTGTAGNAQAATPEEFARYNALNQLAGGANGLAANNIFAGQTAAGGFTPYSYNTQGLESQIAAAKNQYEVTDLQNLQNQLGRSMQGDASPFSSNNVVNRDMGQVMAATNGTQIQGIIPQLVKDYNSQYTGGAVAPQDYVVNSTGFGPVQDYLNQLAAAQGQTIK